jgi:predicted GIY-YIG superfamily endonuclease
MKYYIYIITSDRRHFKIGYTNDISKRVKSLQTGNPKELSLDILIEVGSERQAFNYEQYLHEMFRAFRVKGEWFSYKIKEYGMKSKRKQIYNIVFRSVSAFNYKVIVWPEQYKFDEDELTDAQKEILRNGFPVGWNPKKHAA